MIVVTDLLWLLFIEKPQSFTCSGNIHTHTQLKRRFHMKFQIWRSDSEQFTNPAVLKKFGSSVKAIKNDLISLNIIIVHYYSIWSHWYARANSRFLSFWRWYQRRRLQTMYTSGWYSDFGGGTFLRFDFLPLCFSLLFWLFVMREKEDSFVSPFLVYRSISCFSSNFRGHFLFFVNFTSTFPKIFFKKICISKSRYINFWFQNLLDSGGQWTKNKHFFSGEFRSKTKDFYFFLQLFSNFPQPFLDFSSQNLQEIERS